MISRDALVRMCKMVAADIAKTGQPGTATRNVMKVVGDVPGAADKLVSAEFEFRWNHRIARGIDDTARAQSAIKGAAGKRLTYRRIDQA